MGNRNHSGDTYFWEKVINVLRKHAIKMTAVVLVCGLLGWLVATLFVKPQYQANASLIVNSRDSNTTTITAEQLNSAEELANLYGIIIKSDTVLEAVIRDLDLEMDYDELERKVSVTSVNNTSVMKISVKDADGQNALEILKSIVSISPKIITDMVEAGSVKVVSEPRLQKTAVSPDRQRYALAGAFFGLAVVCVAALLLAVNEDRLYSKREVEERLGLTVIGEIPEQSGGGKKRGKKNGRDRNVILTRNVSFSLKESFRYLRMMIARRIQKDRPKTIIVTSAVAGEGKSCVSINLALSLAADSKRVLLVECDMRKPTICAYLGIRKEPRFGLSSLLQGKNVLQDSVIKNSGISILPAGPIPDNPTELLSSGKMKALMKVLEECYDYVILDTPPSVDMADAVALSSITGGVLFVIRQGFADGQTVEAACDKLRNADANLLGVVLNRCAIDASSSGRRGYGYGGGYGYGYGYNHTREKRFGGESQ